jgi:hypothetical protein
MESEPWPHIIKDDFLDDYQFHLNQVIGRKSIGTAGKYKLSISDQSKFPDIVKYLDCFDHRPFHNGCRVNWYYSVQHGPYDYHIHSEWEKKILSVVVYLGDVGTGTEIYNIDKSYFGQIKWKPNRAFIFAGKDDVTWHSYRSVENETRKTLNGFIIAT